MCTQFVRCTPWSSGESTWVQKTKLQKMSTTHSHERTHALTHPYTDLTTEPRTNLPTHGVLQHYSSILGPYSRTCMRRTCRVSPCFVQGFPFFNDSLPPRGASDPSPGGPFHAPRSPNRSWAPVLSPECPRAAVWWGHSANPRPSEAEWSTGFAAIFWVCYNRHVFKDPFGHHHCHHHHYRQALYNKDTA